MARLERRYRPQAAIVGAGRIDQRVMVHNGQPAARRVLPLSLTFDHLMRFRPELIVATGPEVSLRSAVGPAARFRL